MRSTNFLVVALALVSTCTKASEASWEYLESGTFSRLHMAGQVTWGNRFYIDVDETTGCLGQLGFLVTTYNKGVLADRIGEALPVSLSFLSQGQTKSIVQPVELVDVISDPFGLGAENTPIELAIFSVGYVDSVRDFAATLSAEQVDTIEFTAEDDQIFDIPTESWPVAGLATSVSQLGPCGP